MSKLRDLLPLRILKTVLAFFISISIAPILHIDVFFAGLGSLRSMRESLILSLSTLLEQTIATALAFIISLLAAIIFGISPISITIALLALFLIIKLFNFNDSYLPAGITLIAVMCLSTSVEGIYDSAIMRFVAIVLGTIISLLVNSLLFRPKKYKDVKSVIYQLHQLSQYYISHNLDEYTYLEINSNLEDLEAEERVLNEELSIYILTKPRKEKIRNYLEEIELSKAQCKCIVELTTISDEFREEIIPIINQLFFIKQYSNDINEISSIKKELRRLYYEHTNDDVFYAHTMFLSNMNSYINLLRGY